MVVSDQFDRIGLDPSSCTTRGLPPLRFADLKFLSGHSCEVSPSEPPDLLVGFVFSLVVVGLAPAWWVSHRSFFPMLFSWLSLRVFFFFFLTKGHELRYFKLYFSILLNSKKGRRKLNVCILFYVLKKKKKSRFKNAIKRIKNASTHMQMIKSS